MFKNSRPHCWSRLWRQTMPPLVLIQFANSKVCNRKHVWFSSCGEDWPATRDKPRQYLVGARGWKVVILPLPGPGSYRSPGPKRHHLDPKIWPLLFACLYPTAFVPHFFLKLFFLACLSIQAKDLSVASVMETETTPQAITSARMKSSGSKDHSDQFERNPWLGPAQMDHGVTHGVTDS